MTVEEMLGNLEWPIHKILAGLPSLTKTVNDFPKINTNKMEMSDPSFCTNIWKVN